MAEILLSDAAVGEGQINGDMVIVKSTYGHALGRSELALWTAEKVEGHSLLTGRMEVTRWPHPQDVKAPKCFRWGHQFGPGDLEFAVDAVNPSSAASIGFTLYQIQRGCFPKQVGPKDRKPGNLKFGLYYATGTAGECGQPGLWIVRWCYRKAHGAPPTYADCYFYVLDSVLCPVPGDTLSRVKKWGWG